LTALVHRAGLRPLVLSEHHQLGQITLMAAPDPDVTRRPAVRLGGDVVAGYVDAIRAGVARWAECGARVEAFLAARPPQRGALAGEQVRLRAFRREDLPRVMAWRRDEELRRGALWSDAPFGPREAQRWLRAVSDGADASRVTLAVELLAGSRLVGLTNLTRIDRRAGTAYFG